MDSFITNPTLLGLVAIAISAFGTILGIVLNYRRDQRVANKSDLNDAYERMDKLEAKITARDEVIEEQAEVIRKLRNELAKRDRVIAARDSTIATQQEELSELRDRVSELEKKNEA